MGTIGPLILDERVVGEAVQPPLAGFGGGHDRMAARARVRARVAIRRRVAAERRAARLAGSQVDPAAVDLDAFLALAAIRGNLLYCADSVEQAEYELYVLRRAGDLAPLERERQEIIFDGGR